MRKAKITDNDLVFFDVLKYKKMGNEMSKLEFHLRKANNSFKTIQDLCKNIEEETSVKLSFVK
jgi:hypothetical protein